MRRKKKRGKIKKREEEQIRRGDRKGRGEERDG